MTNPVTYNALSQLVAILLVSIAIAPLGKVAVYSALLGGVIYMIASAYFTLYAFRYRFNGVDDHAGTIIARSFHWGQIGKFSLVALGFALVFHQVSPLHELALFAGFCCLVMAQWFTAVQIDKALGGAA